MNKSRNIDMLKCLSAGVLFTASMLNSYTENLTDNAELIVGKHNGKDFSKLGFSYYNKKRDVNLSNLTDNDLSTTLDTWRQNDNFTHSYFGLVWDSAVSSITKLSTVMVLYPDGGWFGVNNLAPESGHLLTAQMIPPHSQPLVQVSTNNGITWTTVPTKSNYLERVSGVVTDPKGNLVKNIEFELLQPAEGINAIRIIGPSGGKGEKKAKGFVALAELKAEGEKASQSNLAAEGQPFMGLHSGLDLSKYGIFYYHDKFHPRNIVDGNIKTYCDTWSDSQIFPYSFVGITWDKQVKTVVSEVSATLTLFYDGGWFGLSSSVPKKGDILSKKYITPQTTPQLQVSYDKGRNWQKVECRTDYLSMMSTKRVPSKGFHESVKVTFKPKSDLINFTGLRLIGKEGGGNADNDTNGFIAVSEFNVKTTISERLKLDVNCSLEGNEFSWQSESEDFIKGFIVIDSKTQKVLFKTRAIEADLYSVEIKAGVTPQLIIVDVYGVQHKIGNKNNN